MNLPYTKTKRHYRKETEHSDLAFFQVVVEETDLWIGVNKDFISKDASDKYQELQKCALEKIWQLRHEVIHWCQVQADFRTSLVPLAVFDYAPEIIQQMAKGAKTMGVGPFAAVAGAMAQAVAQHLVQTFDPQVLHTVLVENGGDTYLVSKRERIVGLLPMPKQKEQVGLVLKAQDFPLSLCASSATIGHSLSFGKGDLAVVRAKNAALADAAATAYCNCLQNPEDVIRITKQAENDHKLGIDGVFLQCQGSIGIWGNMELTSL